MAFFRRHISVRPLLGVGCCLLSLLGSPESASATPCPVQQYPIGSAAESSLPMVQQLKHRYIGMVGCTVANCHGGGRVPDLAVKRNGSYNAAQVWSQRDPHRNAYRVLANTRSRHMAELLDHADHLGPDATKRADCLACHSTTNLKTNVLPGRRFSFNEGVGCEACHGPAENWVQAHAYNPSGWKQLRANYASNPEGLFGHNGFRVTDDLATRARVCAECHVGSRDRDMHHDMIAAGHPRLTFEFSSYHELLPKHWDANLDRAQHSTTTGRPAFEAKAWIIGQLTTAEVGLELLVSRASESSNRWPELSEYNCYSCHHKLGPKKWVNRSTGNLGQMQWGTWLTPMADEGYLQGLPLGGYDQLKRLVNKTPLGTAAIQQEADRLKGQLRMAARNLGSLEEPAIRSLYENVLANGNKVSGQGWDAAAQNYLGAVALWNAVGELNGNVPTSNEKLERIRKQLLFDGSSDTPKDPSPKEIRELVEKAYKDLAVQAEDAP